MSERMATGVTSIPTAPRPRFIRLTASSDTSVSSGVQSRMTVYKITALKFDDSSIGADLAACLVNVAIVVIPPQVVVPETQQPIWSVWCLLIPRYGAAMQLNIAHRTITNNRVNTLSLKESSESIIFKIISASLHNYA